MVRTYSGRLLCYDGSGTAWDGTARCFGIRQNRTVLCCQIVQYFHAYKDYEYTLYFLFFRAIVYCFLLLVYTILISLMIQFFNVLDQYSWHFMVFLFRQCVATRFILYHCHVVHFVQITKGKILRYGNSELVFVRY